jgi:hypothetical protein
VQGVFSRLGHEHTMAGVDRALTDFPEIEAQNTAVATELNSPPELQTSLCVSTFGGETRIVVLVDNFQAGHQWPSGAAQDRQLWFEVTAYAGGTQIYQSGGVTDGKDPDGTVDQDLWRMRDCMLDEQSKETHLFWEAATNESNTLPGQVTANPMDMRYYQNHLCRAFPSPSSTNKIMTTPDRVTLRVWVQAFPYAVFDDFIPELKGLGYDDAQVQKIRGKLAPVQVSTKVLLGEAGPEPVAGVLEWTPDIAAEQATAGTFANSAGLIPCLPLGVFTQCVTGTGMAIRVQNTLAPTRKACAP